MTLADDMQGLAVQAQAKLESIAERWQGRKSQWPCHLDNTHRHKQVTDGKFATMKFDVQGDVDNAIQQLKKLKAEADAAQKVGEQCIACLKSPAQPLSLLM